MDLQTSFDALSEIVEQFQSNGRALRSVEASAGDESDGVLTATLEVPVSLCPATGEGSRGALRPAAAAVTEGGSLNVEFATGLLDELTDPTRASVSAEVRGVTLGDDGDLVLTVELGIDPCGPAATAESGDDGPPADSSLSGPTPVAEPESASADESGLASVRDDSVPPYEDVPYLRRLYETCDTFAEMSRRIEMDVAAETVRRYMIEAGVHDPTSYDTAAEADPDPSEAGAEEQLVADGVGLPDGLDVDDVVNAVVESTTLFEVQRRLDLDRRSAQELLDRLDLLDLVVHRVAEGPKRQVSQEEVTARIRQCAAGDRAPPSHT